MGDRAQLCIQGNKKGWERHVWSHFPSSNQYSGCKAPALCLCPSLAVWKTGGANTPGVPSTGEGSSAGILHPHSSCSSESWQRVWPCFGPGLSWGHARSVPVAFPCPRLLPEGEELFTLCQVGHCSPGLQPAAFPAGALMTFLVPVTRWGPGPRLCSIHRSIHRCQLGNQSRLSRGDTAPRSA